MEGGVDQYSFEVGNAAGSVYKLRLAAHMNPQIPDDVSLQLTRRVPPFATDLEINSCHPHMLWATVLKNAIGGGSPWGNWLSAWATSLLDEIDE